MKNPDFSKIKEAVENMVERIKVYVPGYSVLLGPIMDGNKVTTMIQVEGLGGFLPTYAGNLDIINCAAVQVGEAYAAKLSEVE